MFPLFSTNHAIALITSIASLRSRCQLCKVRRKISRTRAYARGVPLARSTKNLTKKPNWHLSRRLHQHVYDTLLEIQNWHEVKNYLSNNAKRSVKIIRRASRDNLFGMLSFYVLCYCMFSINTPFENGG